MAIQRDFVFVCNFDLPFEGRPPVTGESRNPIFFPHELYLYREIRREETKHYVKVVKRFYILTGRSQVRRPARGNEGNGTDR